MKKKRGIISIVLISIIAVIFIIPLVYMVSTSLKPKSEVLQDTISLIGSRVTTENYERAWNAFPFARYMFNSIFVGLATTALTVFTSAMAAYAFARLKFKGRDKVFFVYLSTLMVPIQVTIIPLYMILRILGWHDSYAALIVPPVFSAFGVFMLRSKPGLASLAIFTFVNSWKSFFWPLIVTSSDKYKTLPIGLYAFSGQYGTDWSALMAATAISIIPGVIFYIIFQKSLVEGISLTGMGGR